MWFTLDNFLIDFFIVTRRTLKNVVSYLGDGELTSKHDLFNEILLNFLCD